MEKNIAKRVLLNTFWLSVLLHLLFLASFTLVIVWQPKQEQTKSPNYYVPSYVYSKSTPTIQKQSASRSEHRQSQEKERSVEQAEKQAAMPESKKGMPRKSILATTLNMLQENQLKAITASFKNQEPIYLVGQENAVSDPFIILIGKALSAHFAYPRTAGELGITGTVLVSMTIHPEGYFSDVQIVKSSDNRDLDAAALYAVNQAPVIKYLNRYLSKPKRFVVGFIFH